MVHDLCLIGKSMFTDRVVLTVSKQPARIPHLKRELHGNTETKGGQINRAGLELDHFFICANVDFGKVTY